MNNTSSLELIAATVNMEADICLFDGSILWFQFLITSVVTLLLSILKGFFSQIIWLRYN